MDVVNVDKESRSVAIVTVSDRSAAGLRADTVGPLLEQVVQLAGWQLTRRCIVSDDAAAIVEVLRDLCEREVALVLTTGGTGLGPRDTTPEATRAVITREVPGIAEAMRAAGMAKTPRAALSRALCGTHMRTLIVNLPGSPSGATESLESVIGVLGHAVDVLRAPQFDHDA